MQELVEQQRQQPGPQIITQSGGGNGDAEALASLVNHRWAHAYGLLASIQELTTIIEEHKGVVPEQRRVFERLPRDWGNGAFFATNTTRFELFSSKIKCQAFVTYIRNQCWPGAKANWTPKSDTANTGTGTRLKEALLKAEKMIDQANAQLDEKDPTFGVPESLIPKKVAKSTSTSAPPKNNSNPGATSSGIKFDSDEIKANDARIDKLLQMEREMNKSKATSGIGRFTPSGTSTTQRPPTAAEREDIAFAKPQNLPFPVGGGRLIQPRSTLSTPANSGVGCSTSTPSTTIHSLRMLGHHAVTKPQTPRSATSTPSSSTKIPGIGGFDKEGRKREFRARQAGQKMETVENAKKATVQDDDDDLYGAD
jgi:hypothetical protein